MCGICGIVDQNQENHQLIVAMADLLRHRGPEKAGYFHQNEVSLGHRRLSIIDLQTGDQPIFNEDRSIVVVFNGEIYNYRDIRQQLSERGHRFTTNSDTEVVVHAYEEFGLSFLKDLNGIFAFALYDIPHKRLILVRDHFGVKPLHYWFKDGVLLFASEIKAILLHPAVERRPNRQALHCQLNLRYNQGEETLFAGIHRLPPAHYLIYEQGRIHKVRYYQLPVNINHHIGEDEAIEGIRFYLQQAVKRQLISDVPIGVYLSGGLDSSTIVAMMSQAGVNPIPTFTLGFNEPTDEFADAALVTRHFQTEHTTTALTPEPLQRFPETIWFAEEPKINLLQGFHMSEFVARSLKVVLGGLGGDELFIGYDIYKYLHAVQWLLRSQPGGWQRHWAEPLSALIFKIQQGTKILKWDEYRRGLQMLLAVGNLERFYLILRNCWDFDWELTHTIFQPDFYNAPLTPVAAYFDEIFEACRELPPLDAIAYVEFHSKMVNDYLLVDDRMSMAHSLELRVPFLDKDLVEFAFTIPASLKMKHGTTKYLFRKAMTGILPQSILRKPKWGFAVNPYEQFKKDLKQVAERILTPEFVKQQRIFNYAYLRRILDYPPHPRLRWHYNYLWVVLGYTIWEQMFINSDNFKKRLLQTEEYYH